MKTQTVEIVVGKHVFLAKRWVEFFLDADTGNRIPVNRHSSFKKTKKKFWAYN